MDCGDCSAGVSVWQTRKPEAAAGAGVAKTTQAAMRPQPFRQDLLDPRAGCLGARVVSFPSSPLCLPLILTEPAHGSPMNLLTSGSNSPHRSYVRMSVPFAAVDPEASRFPFVLKN